MWIGLLACLFVTWVDALVDFGFVNLTCDCSYIDTIVLFILIVILDMIITLIYTGWGGYCGWFGVLIWV